jgi:hypothetical protein
MELQDAVSEGLYQFVTQTTVDALASVFATDLDPSDVDNGGGGDPFDDPPVQP